MTNIKKGFGSTCLIFLMIGIEQATSAAQSSTIQDVPVNYSAEKSVTVTTEKIGGTTYYKTAFSPNGRMDALTFAPTNGGDWSGASAFMIDVKSGSSLGIPLRIIITDSMGTIYTGNVTLAPNQEKVVALPFSPINAASYGFYEGPPLVKYIASNVQQVFQSSRSPSDANWSAPAHAMAIRLETDASLTGGTVNLSFGQPQIQLGGTIRHVYDGLIDQFGQSTQSSWPEKVSSVSDMIAKESSETPRLQAWTADRSDLDNFEGVKAISLPNSSGFFRTAYSNGKWWLVTPEGHAFFQLAVDLVDYSNGFTVITNREYMFPNVASLRAQFPNQLTPIVSKPGFQYFNFMGANLERKYGSQIDPGTGLPNYLQKFKDRATWRLKAWRFNTIGSVSNLQFARKPTLPFVVELRTLNYITGAMVPGYLSNHFGNVPDPFDPAFPTNIETMVRQTSSENVHSPYLIGYFVDNELAWGDDLAGNNDKLHYALPVGALGLDYDSSPAKRNFFLQLYRKYGDIAKLNTAWGTSIPSWAELKRPFTSLPAAVTSELRTDFSTFLSAFAYRYYGTIKQVLKNLDPNHLYLGSRYAHSERPIEALQACIANCDVISVNYYSYQVSWSERLAFEKIGKPVIISEFHFGSADRGNFWPGLEDAGSEANRGQAYATFVKGLASVPNIVGCDWYAYADQPTSGEPYDSGNAHNGFVSIADVAFPDFAASVRNTNLNVVTWHAESKP